MRWTRKAEPKPEPKNKPLWGPLNEEIEKDKPRWTYLVPTFGTLIQATVAFIAAICVLVPTWRNYVETQEKNRVERKENTIRRLETQFSEVQTRLANPDPQTRAVAVLQLADLAQVPLPAETLTPEEIEKEVKITDFSRTHYPFFLRAARQYATTLPMEKDAGVRAATKDAVFLLITFLRKYMPRWDADSPAPISPPEALLALEPEYTGQSYKITGEDGKSQTVEYNITEAEVALTEMTNELADANRKAKDNFIRAYANYLAKNPPKAAKASSEAQKRLIFDDDLMLAMTYFCRVYNGGNKATIQALEDLRGTERYKIQTLYQKQRSVPNPTQKQQTKAAALLDTLEQEAQKLVDTRDALATTLTWSALPSSAASIVFTAWNGDWGYEGREIPTNPSGFPAKATIVLQGEVTNEILDKIYRATETLAGLNREGWRRKPALRLNDCFLVGADLVGARLQGANLSGTMFQGANLRFAQLQGAELTFAKMQGASLDRTYLMRANLQFANFQGALFSYTGLQGASLYGVNLKGTEVHAAQLQGADISGAKLQGASFWLAHLEGANFGHAQFDDKTSLYGIYVQPDASAKTSYKQTKFPNTHWQERNFQPRNKYYRSPEGDERTKRIIEWLKKTFPPTLKEKTKAAKQ